MLRRFLIVLSLSALIAGFGLAAVNAQDDKKDPEKKEPKKPLPKFDFDFPKFDELFKGLPLDPAQTKELMEQLERAREMWRKAMEGKGGAFPLPGPFPAPFPPFPGPFPKMDLKVDRGAASGRLGVQVEAPSATLIEQLGLIDGGGLVVVGVRPDSPAAKAGLKTHDILMEWAGKPVFSDPAELKEMVDKTGKDPVEIKVLRRGKLETIKGLTLPERKAEPPRVRPRLDVRRAERSSSRA